MSRAEDTIDLVIRRHKGPRIAVSYCDLKWLEMDLPQRSFWNPSINEESSSLLIVTGEVLDTCTNTTLLDGIYKLSGEFSREERVFAVCLKIAPTKRCAWRANCLNSGQKPLPWI